MTHTIAGTYTALVRLGAAIDNPTTITKAGLLNDGLQVSYPGLAMANAGLIAASTTDGVGVQLVEGGSVTSQSGGTISGYWGIFAENDAATVVNAGTISGVRDAVEFTAGFANRLIADPGAVFTGAVYGGGGVLELVSAAGAGTLFGLGTSITNFSTLQFDAGAAWTVSGDDVGSGLGGIVIAGFPDIDTIDLTGFVAVSDTFANNGLVLIDAGGGQATLNIDGTFGADAFQTCPCGRVTNQAPNMPMTVSAAAPPR